MNPRSPGERIHDESGEADRMAAPRLMRNDLARAAAQRLAMVPVSKAIPGFERETCTCR
jgi:hypothetical protein